MKSRLPFLVVALLAFGPAGLRAATPLAKIHVTRDGRRFETENGRPFVPFGVNYYRPGTGWAPQVWKKFDAEATRHDFARMKEFGVNCVRVFLSYGSFCNEIGVLDTNGLAKFDQFLAMAEAARIYVHPTGPDHWEGTPAWTRVDRIADERTLLGLEMFWKEFAARYRGRAVILAYDLRNEPEVLWDTPPLREKWNRWAAQRYPSPQDMARAWNATNRTLLFGELSVPQPKSAGERELLDYQLFREDVADEWTRRQVSAIKAADANALVTVGLIQWSVPSLLPRLEHYSGFRPERQARLLDFLEVHFYPLEHGAYEYRTDEEEGRNLAYLETVVREVARPGKPVILAEYGWYGGGKPKFDGGRHPAATEEQQARWCRRVVETTAGFAVGWLNWGFYDQPEATDCSEFTGLVTANGKTKAWGSEFGKLSSRYSDQAIPRRPLASRPALDWERCLLSPAAGNAFREEYYRAWKRDADAAAEALPPPANAPASRRHAAGAAHGADSTPLRRFTESQDTNHATIRVHADRRSAHRIPRFITGKFAEHLGFNIYGGMDAQILRNPTFADYPFWNGAMTPDGVAKFHVEDEKIGQELRRLATRFGAPDSALDSLVAARADGLAALWLRAGPRRAVQVSSDAGPHGRAQRVQVEAAGQGIAQWAYLPLHRVRTYAFEIIARSPDLKTLTVRLTLPSAGNDQAPARAIVTTTATGLDREWRKLSGTFGLPADAPAEAAYRFEILAQEGGQFVVSHCFLHPVDHIHGADAEVVKFLRESHLPLLRWPGGNFASTYHWEDAIGPMDQRVTKPNFAWGGLELNTFGTDEFIAFCRAVGCEPMICVNAGRGTPAEATRWIEYCNGSPTTPMGARRAAHGHPEPYLVKHWEVGNELWGRWQMGWTTASGYVDRFKQFSRAMLAADPTVHLYACGAPVLWGKNWNDTLIAGAAPELGSTTDHPLIGGSVSRNTDPLDVFRDFMAVPEVLERKWRDLERDMTRGGVKEPRLAVTELQMFAHLGGEDGNSPSRLTRENLVSPATLGEALFDVLIYHAAVRLGPFVEMVTHSATVNHGGGLRKDRERVWASPCHYAQAAFAAFAGATPVEVEIEAAAERAPLVLPELQKVTREETFGAIDALAAVGTDGALLLSLVNRNPTVLIHTSVILDQFNPAASAEVRMLSAHAPWAANTLEQPEAIMPRATGTAVRDGKLEVQMPPGSVVGLRIPNK